MNEIKSCNTCTHKPDCRIGSEVMLNPTCSELVMRFEGKTKQELISALNEIGIIEIERLENFWGWERKSFKEGVDDEEIADLNAIKHVLVDKDNQNTPDFKYHSHILIEEHFKGYSDEEDTLAIVAHQHSQHQIFPTIKKIEEHFDVRVEGFDGGGDAQYLEWVEKRKTKIPDYNKEYEERRTELWGKEREKKQ